MQQKFENRINVNTSLCFSGNHLLLQFICLCAVSFLYVLFLIRLFAIESYFFIADTFQKHLFEGLTFFKFFFAFKDTNDIVETRDIQVDSML